VPKKGTPEYERVKAIQIKMMAAKAAAAAPAAPAAVPAPAKRVRKVLLAPEAAAEPVAAEKKPRRSRVVPVPVPAPVVPEVEAEVVAEVVEAPPCVEHAAVRVRTKTSKARPVKKCTSKAPTRKEVFAPGNIISFS